MINTSTSSERATKIVIPELRFPEFVKDGEWKEKTLGNLGKFTGGGTPSKANDSFWEGIIPWVSSSDIFEDSIHQIKISRFITEQALLDSATKLVPENSILLVSRVGVGKLAISKQPVCTSQDFTNFTPDKDNLMFLAYILKTHSKTLLEYSQGMAIKGFTKDDASKLGLFIPTQDEQQKIADCLSSLDELISAENQKLDVLKVHKKGLMQNLFPQEGETEPIYRFPEFVKDGEWVEKTLGSVAKIVTGSTPSTLETINYNGTRLFVSPADINDNRYITHTKTTLSDIGFLKTRKIKANSVLFVCIGSTIGKVAQNKIECATNQQLNSLIADGKNSSEFLYSILENNSKKIASIAGIHAVPIINKSSFSAIKLSFPFKLDEQQKISSCLSSLDALITAQVEKIEQLKQHKKGLMQGLFPSITN